jgi:hypothetical protein
MITRVRAGAPATGWGRVGHAKRKYEILLVGIPMRLAIVAVLVFLLNIPFGYWRSGVRKFSWRWILAIHAPVPAVVALRMASGIGFQPISFPVLIAAFFLGQRFGGTVVRRRSQSDPIVANTQDSLG